MKGNENTHVRAVVIKDFQVLTIERQVSDMLYWCFPGGGIEDSDKDELEALERELMEETNVSVRPIKPIWERIFLGHKEKYYLCRLVKGKIGRGNGPEYQVNGGYIGSHEPKWLPVNKLGRYDLKPNELRNVIVDITRNCKTDNDFKKAKWEMK